MIAVIHMPHHSKFEHTHEHLTAIDTSNNKHHAINKVKKTTATAAAAAAATTTTILWLIRKPSCVSWHGSTLKTWRILLEQRPIAHVPC